MNATQSHAVSSAISRWLLQGDHLQLVVCNLTWTSVLQETEQRRQLRCPLCKPMTSSYLAIQGID